MVQAPHPETGVEPSFALSEGPSFDSAAGADNVVVSDTDFMLGAEFKRSGPDLVLLGDDKRLLIPDYFKHERLPDLVGPDGARLDGDLVNTLAGPMAPGQYAQATSTPPERIAIGRVDKASGFVQITRANGVTEVSLAPGAVVYKGDVIQTGRGASVSVSFGDGTALNLAAFTRMVMNEFAYDPNLTTNSGVMTLVRGSFAFIAGKVAKTGGLEVHTPVATMGIRGTTGGVIQIEAGNYKFYAEKDIDGADSTYKITYSDASGIANQATVTVGTIAGVNINDPAHPLTFTPASGPDLSPADQAARDFFNSLFNNLIANYPNVLQDLPPLPSNQGQRTDAQPNANTTTAAASGAASGGSSGIVTPTTETTGQASPDQSGTPTQLVLDVPSLGSGGPLTVTLTPLYDIPTTAPPITQLSNNPTTLPGGITALPGSPSILAGLPTVTLVAAGDNGAGTDTSLVQLSVGSNVASYDTTGWTANPDGTFSQTGTFGTATLDPAQNSVTYHLDNTSAQTKALADQQSVSDPFTVTVKGSDGSTIASAPVLFSIVGTNDAPTIGAATLSGEVTENATSPAGTANDTGAETIGAAALTVNATLAAETVNETVSGTIAFGDVDLTDVHVVSAAFKGTDDTSGQPLGSLVAVKTSDTTGSGSDGLITWTFTASDAALDRLAAGQVVNETYTITLSDEHGGVVTRDVLITLTGTNDAPVVSDAVTGGGAEDSGTVTVNLLDFTSDVDSGAVLHIENLVWDEGPGLPAGFTAVGNTLEIDTNAAAYNQLAEGASFVTHFSYDVVDEHGEITAQTATITLTGTNDAPVVSDVATGGGAEGSGTATVNLLDFASDVDNGALLHIENLVWDEGPGLPAGFTAVGNTLEIDTNAAAYNQLAEGASFITHFSYDVVDEHGEITAQTATITLTGTNDAPMVSNTVTGGGAEDSGTATVNLLDFASDVDTGAVLHIENLVWNEGEPGNLPAGFTVVGNTLEIDTDAAAYNQLTAGGTFITHFSYDVVDEHGATAAQTATITITGTNSAPVITAGATTGSVTEDSAGQNQASGQLTVTDPDVGDIETWSVAGANYHFRATDFKVTGNILNGVFEDTFSDGLAPPTLPTGTTGFGGSYGGIGGFTESNGALHLDSNNAVLFAGVGTSNTIVGENAILKTNFDPEQTTAGLKQATNFTIAAVFDLVLPDRNGEAYGIRATDRLIGSGTPFDQAGDNIYELVVRQDQNGNDVVALRHIDFVTDVTTNIEWFSLAPPTEADQIRLVFTHTANDEALQASFQYLSNGEVVGSQSFSASAPVFAPGSEDTDNWTRAEIVAYSPVVSGSTVNGAYGTLEIDQMGHWTYTLDNARQATQILAEGQHATDNFVVQVADPSGAQDTKLISIDVTGTNDAPVVSDMVTGGGAEGSGTVTVNLLDFASDVDNGAVLHIENLVWDEGEGLPAGFTAVGNTLEIDTSSAAYNQLAENGAFIAHFSYDVVDEHGGIAAQTATITITGTNDAPVVSDGTVTNGMTEAVAITALGVPFTALAASYLSDGNSLVNGLGGASGFGEEVLLPNDDGSTGAIDLTAVFGPQGLNFFGTPYETLYINNNGNISFGGSLSAFTPQAIGANSLLKIIAPFWADVDTRGGPTAPDNTGTSDGANLVFYDLDPVNHVLTVTWDDVGYYGSHTDKADAFQLQLIGLTNGDFDIVFRYEDINWTTGDASQGSGGLGGTPARAGFSDGQGNSIELTQSGTADMLDLPTIMGNTGIEGVYVFQSHDGAVVPTLLSTSGVINFSDPDLTDAHTASATFLGVGEALGIFSLVQNSDTTGTGTGGQFVWTYTVDPHDITYLTAGESTTETFRVDISDGHGGDVIQDVTVTLVGVDDAPVAMNDWVVTNFGAAAFDIPEWVLLANDSDPEGGAIDVAADSVGTTNSSGVTVDHTVGSGSDGYVTVTDAGGDDGSFQYAATDGTLTGAAATVTVDNNSTETALLTTTMNGHADAPTILIGGNNADTLTGGQYNDILLGSGGNNVLIGGAGNDTFIFTPSATPHTDVITDFTTHTANPAQADVIDLSAYPDINTFDDVSALLQPANDGADTTVNLPGGATVTLTGVQIAQLHENDFILHH